MDTRQKASFCSFIIQKEWGDMGLEDDAIQFVMASSEQELADYYDRTYAPKSIKRTDSHPRAGCPTPQP